MNAPLRVSPGPAPPGLLTVMKGQCGDCNTGGLCLSTGLDSGSKLRFDRLVGQHRRIAAGDTLYRTGQPLRSLYALRCGFFKTRRHGPAGDQITGFPMAGELMGLEAVGTGIHQSDAIALEDSIVCELPFAGLERLFEDIPGLHRRFYRLMSCEINREQHLMLLLGHMRAEQRMATFLADMGAAYAARGYSPAQFQLRMSREDIGSYLGLTIESISRLLGRFTKLGLITVDKRAVVLTDPQRIAEMASGFSPCSPMV
jgi:CRP/FNR family transcriptional regulator